jgi:hypothetical protein
MGGPTVNPLDMTIKEGAALGVLGMEARPLDVSEDAQATRNVPQVAGDDRKPSAGDHADDDDRDECGSHGGSHSLDVADGEPGSLRAGDDDTGVDAEALGDATDRAERQPERIGRLGRKVLLRRAHGGGVEAGEIGRHGRQGDTDAIPCGKRG